MLGRGCEGDIREAVITRAEPEENRHLVGKLAVTVAAEQNKALVDLFLDIVAQGGQVGFYMPCQSEQDNIELIQYPWTVFGSDASVGKHEEMKGIGPGGALLGHGYGLFLMSSSTAS